jgi:MFS family permease
MRLNGTDRQAKAAVSVVFFANGCIWGSWSANVPVLQERLQISGTQLGLAFSIASAAAMLFLPIAGALVNRLTSRKAALLGSALLLGSVPLAALMPTYPMMVAVLAFAAVSNTLMDMGMNTNAVGVQDRIPHPVLSALHGWFSVGGFAGGITASVAARASVSPWIHILAVAVMLASCIALVARLILREDPKREDSESGPVFSIPKGPVLLVGLLLVAAFAAEGGAWDWSTLYLRSVVLLPQEISALGFSLLSICMAIGRFLGDGAIARFGHQPVLSVSAAMVALGVFLAVGMPLPFVAPVGLAILGLGLANLVPILFKAAGYMPGQVPAIAISGITTVGYLAFLLGPTVLGRSSDAFGLRVAFLLIALYGLVVAICGPAILRRFSSLR